MGEYVTLGGIMAVVALLWRIITVATSYGR